MLSGRVASLPSQEYKPSYQSGPPKSSASWSRVEKSSSPLQDWRRSPQTRKSSRSPPMAPASSTRKNQYFLPGEGIRREVITADICRYLGNDALVKPGQYEGRDGYWITAYRALTSQMIADLKSDSQRWAEESEQVDTRVPYRDSRTHEFRQAYGPTPAHGQSQSLAPSPMDTRMDTRAPQAPSQGDYYYPQQQAAPHGYAPSSQYASQGSYAAPDYPPPVQENPYIPGSVHYGVGTHTQQQQQPRIPPGYGVYPGQNPADGQYTPGHEGYHPPAGVPRGGQHPSQSHARDPYSRGGFS